MRYKKRALFESACSSKPSPLEPLVDCFKDVAPCYRVHLHVSSLALALAFPPYQNLSGSHQAHPLHEQPMKPALPTLACLQLYLHAFHPRPHHDHNRHLLQHRVSTRLRPLLQARKGIHRSPIRDQSTSRHHKHQSPASRVLRPALIHQYVDLADLSAIKAPTEAFLAKKTRLGNSGVLGPAQCSRTAQDYELQLSTDRVGPFLFRKLLRPILALTAETAPAGFVRVVWISSSSAELSSPQHGVDMSNLDHHVDKSAVTKYGISKAGNFFRRQQICATV